jgi:hypothetical protein
VLYKNQSQAVSHYKYAFCTPKYEVQEFYVECPRNNQIFFSVRTETNRNSICFGCFSVCFAKPKKHFFGLFRCFGPVSKQPKQTEFSRNKPKKSPKTFSIRGSLKQLILFSRFEPKLNLFQLFFGLLFRETNKFFFSVCFDVLDCYRTNRNKQNLWYGELKRLIF